MAIKLYSTTFCPYAWCARIVLNEKGVPFEVFEVDLKAKQDEFVRISPTGKVPVLVDGETRVWESMVINEYLEEKYGGPNLLGESPEDRAEVRASVLEINCSRSQPLARLAAMLYYNRERRDDERVQVLLDRWLIYLDELDAYFEQNQWYSLGRFSLADISLYTLVRVSQGFGVPVGASKRPHLNAWMGRMDARESVRRSAPQRVPDLAEHYH